MSKEKIKSEISMEYERSLYNGKKIVCGVDEAGRGPLAGNVYAAAVILPENYEEIPELSPLNDSKKLSEKKRDELAKVIKEKSIAYCVAFATVQEIEKINILNAALLAMKRAIEGLEIKPEFALIDGNCTKNLPIECKSVVSGDAKCPSIAAASILAKTERDKYCYEYLDKIYPQYCFAKHKGYGTKLHYDAVEKYGLCKEHRPSFFKKYFEKKQRT